MNDKEGVIGLYGCYCHPFKSWEDHKHYDKQKIPIGSIVKIRCTQQFAIIESLKDYSGYVHINILPCTVERDKTIEHNSNLIQSKDFTDSDKTLFNKLKRKQLNQLSII
ncbi:hypothetical protein HX017_15370 [Myroides marinus]|uniref:hypothetical protein n=1 Tax=Myroides marinus TaxID=703342 RepID=UPI00257657B4|nr:hypothetical protein [Myroides marinus]MDM1366320.1 hypothetical protein [Myroides marinus]